MPDHLQPASQTMQRPVSRWRFAVRWALAHLGISVAVAALSSWLVFSLWYPSPWRQLLGVAGIFGLVVVVDVVCGPLLTLVLASPQKSRRERWIDLSLVAVIQLAALGYGLWSVFSARPVAVVFEVDRLVVVTANEVQTEQLPDAPKGLQSLPWHGVHTVSLRKPVSSEEFLKSMDQSLQGVTQAMRPGWWRPLDEARSALNMKTKPLDALMNKRPEQRDVLLSAAAKTGLPVTGLRYLPLTSTKRNDWVALFNASGAFVGSAPVDGFD